MNEIDDADEAEDPRCSECGEPLLHAEDIEDGCHFLCIQEPDETEWDEGGESGE